jgi:hypothetical protein
MDAISGPFSILRGLPYYNEPTTHLLLGNRLYAWEFNGWKPESMSWKTGCYIHGGLSDMEFHFAGPDIIPFFSSICTNGFATFPIGSLKHAVMCREDGLIAAHGILRHLPGPRAGRSASRPAPSTATTSVRCFRWGASTSINRSARRPLSRRTAFPRHGGGPSEVSWGLHPWGLVFIRNNWRGPGGRVASR